MPKCNTNGHKEFIRFKKLMSSFRFRKGFDEAITDLYLKGKFKAFECQKLRKITRGRDIHLSPGLQKEREEILQDISDRFLIPREKNKKTKRTKKMGEISDAIIAGELCAHCGAYLEPGERVYAQCDLSDLIMPLDDGGAGIPVLCEDCNYPGNIEENIDLRDVIIRPGGLVEKVSPVGEFFTLKELQELVGGLIQMIRIPGNRTIVLNEEGKLLELDFNLTATSLYKGYLFEGDYLVGNVIVIDNKYLN